MKKSVLAVALAATFSGTVAAENIVKIPDGYQVMSQSDGKVIVYQTDAQGNAVGKEAHYIVDQDTTFVHEADYMGGYEVTVSGSNNMSDEEYNSLVTDVDASNKANGFKPTLNNRPNGPDIADVPVTPELPFLPDGIEPPLAGGTGPNGGNVGLPTPPETVIPNPGAGAGDLITPERPDLPTPPTNTGGELPDVNQGVLDNLVGNDVQLGDDIKETNDKLDQTNDKLDSVTGDLNDKIDANKDHQDKVNAELGDGIGAVNDKIDQVATAGAQADAALNDKIDANQAESNANDAALNDKIDANQAANDKVNTEQDKGIASNSDKIDANQSQSNANDQALADYIDQINAETNGAVASNKDAIDQLDGRVSKNEANINKLFGEVDRLDERVDAIGATAQAVTAARPQLAQGQTSAVGVGLGYMGEATALSIGYGHKINENWSANANVATTFGVQDNDFSMGAGVQYAW